MELSQNLKNVLKEIGENSVLLQLCMRLHDKSEWHVYHSYKDNSCDLVLVGPKKKIKIEVKTRQNYIKKSQQNKKLQFTISHSEYNSAAYLIAYWFDRSAYFIVPMSALTKSKNGKKNVYKFIAYHSEVKNDFTEPSKKYHEKWDSLLKEIDL